MSSITFPLGHQSSPSSDNDAHGFYPPPSFDGNSSFQMNPLSSHPPRTPRTSLIIASHSHVYGTDIYEDAEEKQPQSIDVDEDVDEEEVNVKDLQHKVHKEDIWREMILTSNGRDKAFVSSQQHMVFSAPTHYCIDPQKKLIQYSIRVYLFFHFSLTTSSLLRKISRPPWEKELIKRLTSTMSGLSFTRLYPLRMNV